MRMTIEQALEQLQNPRVTELDVYDCDFGLAEAKQIAEALPKSNITKLNLEHNHIGALGGEIIAAALPASKVTTVNLVGNQIGDRGALAIAAALPHSKLKKLLIGGNYISEKGAAAIAEGAAQSRLAILDIRSNRLGDAGAVAIASFLPLTEITELSLSDNDVGDVGGAAIAKALPSSVLAFLSMHGSHLTDVGVSAFVEAVPHSALSKMYLRIWAPKGEAEERCSAFVKANHEAAQRLIKKMQHGRFLPWERFTEADVAAFTRLAPAVSYLLKGDDNKVSDAEVSKKMMGMAERLHEDGHDVKPLMLRLLPLEDVRAWCSKKGVALHLSDMLNPDGRVPQDRFMCRGGGRALFMESELWESKAQFNKAFRSLPPAHRAVVPNAHQLSAELSTAGRKSASSRG